VLCLIFSFIEDYSAKTKNNTRKGILMKPQTKKLIMIGESLHASIARCGEAMDKAYNSNDFESKQYIQELITSQASAGADFIEVNVDKFCEAGEDIAVDMMREYVSMVVAFGAEAAVCIDSSNDNLLAAGLDAYYEAGGNKKPLINSVKPYNADKILPLAEKMPFSFIALLMTHDSINPLDELQAQALLILEKALACGFTRQDIYFDTGAFPLAIDMPMLPDEKGRTFTAFEAIRMLKNNPRFEGVHFSLGVSNCLRNLPGRREEMLRAYLSKAIDYGLDAAIIDVRGDWFAVAADRGLVELVEAFASIDGSQERFEKAMFLMAEFCADCREKRNAL
jgi:5-methyltetrahydrofolate corrinoid/iron sulfur protein methyltransferase